MAKEAPPFKEFLFNYFIDWEKNQPGKRSTFTAFARWLSDNSFHVTIKQQLVSDWIKGKYEPGDEKYQVVLAEKLGEQIYEILHIPPVNLLRIYVLRNWDKAPLKIQQELAKTISKHTTEPMPNVHESSPAKSK